MILKQPILLFSSHSPHIYLGWNSALSQSSSHLPHHDAPSLRRRPRQLSRRAFASVHDQKSSSSAGNLSWPETPDPRQIPTPYQIFNQRRDEPYSKERFYGLVKLYHPDRNRNIDDASNPSGCSHAIMIERYHLIIAAHAILSDPVKRKAYDHFGQGWSNHKAGKEEDQSWMYTTTHRWRNNGNNAYQWSVDDDPMYNATWEDWERWYQRRKMSRRRRSGSFNWYSTSNPWATKSSQNTVYATNHTFITLICIVAALGGLGQATRVNEWTKSRQERLALANLETNEKLSKARQDSRDRYGAGETKDDRIKRFLREKDSYAEGEFDARALREDDPSLCASNALKGKEEHRYWEKPPES